MLTGKGVNRVGYGNKGNGIIRADYESKKNNSASSINLFRNTNILLE